MLPESPGHPGSLAPCAIIDNLPHDLSSKVVDDNGEHVGFHPHCHVLCTDGCFYGKGGFRVAPRFDSKGLKAIFEHTVSRMLLSKGKITQDLVAMLRSWGHLGFQVYVGPRIQPGEEEATENLSRYIIRAFFSQERMTYLQEESKVLYQSKDGKMEKIFDALEWLAAMTSHVPNKGEQMVSYYPVRREDESHRRHRACLCRHGRQASGGRLPAGRQVRQILDHLGLPTAAPSLRPPPNQPDGLAADQPREWSYEPLG